MFPDLVHRPRPEPNPAEKGDHGAWLNEYKEWGALTCPGSCEKGYFCRQHGSWISGREVADGVAAPASSQAQDTCPAYHYGG